MDRVLQSISKHITIVKVWFENRTIYVQMNNGNVIARSVDLYPHLRNGTPQQWQKFDLWGGGKSIHWEELDEDLSAEGFLKSKWKNLLF
jgi:hypothetical protein